MLRFRDIASFLPKEPPHPTPILRETCNYFGINSTYTTTVHQRHGRTDGRLRPTITIPRFAVCASRGKKSTFTDRSTTEAVSHSSFLSRLLTEMEAEVETAEIVRDV